MKRYAEAVLNGHPDKFCDLMADAILRYAYTIDPEAYGQIEAAVWSDRIFLTGALVTRTPFPYSIRDIVIETGLMVGYTPQNYIDVHKYIIDDNICKIHSDPTTWTHFVNDQNIVHGYAGYGPKTHFLPPEQFAVHFIRERLIRAMEAGGLLHGHGPDGKLLVIMNEYPGAWELETLVVTLQQKQDYPFTRFTQECCEVVSSAFHELLAHDTRWTGLFSKLKLLINPNGPLLNGGSDGDNGQTGRKLVMDYYGPRIPIGGGALYGKDLSHIDRVAAFRARQLAVNLSAQSGEEVFIRVCYAPGMDQPILTEVQSPIRPGVDLQSWFSFPEMRKDISNHNISYDPALLGTFYNPAMSFNKW